MVLPPLHIQDWIAPLAGYLVVARAELRIHNFNRFALLELGAEEFLRPQTKRINGLWYHMLALSLVEAVWFPTPLPVVLRLVVLAVLVASLSLQIWVMTTLGPLWSKSLLRIPGSPVLARGPYRWANHPEYIARSLNGAAIFLLMGSPVTAIAFAVIHGFFCCKIAPIESQLLAEQRDLG